MTVHPPGTPPESESVVIRYIRTMDQDTEALHTQPGFVPGDEHCSMCDDPIHVVESWQIERTVHPLTGVVEHHHEHKGSRFEPYFEVTNIPEAGPTKLCTNCFSWLGEVGPAVAAWAGTYEPEPIPAPPTPLGIPPVRDLLLTASHGRPELQALAREHGWSVDTLPDGSVSLTKPGRLIRLTFTKADPDRLNTASWSQGPHNRRRHTRGGIAVSQVAHEIRADHHAIPGE